MAATDVRERVVEFVKFLGCVCMIYVATAIVVYAFRHPELTQTEVMLRIGEALLWR